MEREVEDMGLEAQNYHVTLKGIERSQGHSLPLEGAESLDSHFGELSA
jgi:hypothetical protein